jgi:hypothetical protein
MKVVLCGLLISYVGFGATISLGLDAPTQITTPGSFITFSGTITDTGSDEVFLNGASVTLPYFELNYDLTPFFTLSPPSLSSGDSWSGNIFTVAISGVATPGDYFGSLSIEGGDDSSTYDDLADQSFQVTVSDVPEPAPVFFVIPAIALFIAMGKLKKGKESPWFSY